MRRGGAVIIRAVCPVLVGREFGIATGAAVVGRLAGDANVSVIGETTNLASRLQAQAAASEILVSDETHRRLHDRLEAYGLTATAEQLVLKGFDSPVSVYRISNSR